MIKKDIKRRDLRGKKKGLFKRLVKREERGESLLGSKRSISSKQYLEVKEQ